MSRFRYTTYTSYQVSPACLTKQREQRGKTGAAFIVTTGCKAFRAVSIDACRRFAASRGRKTYKQVETSGTQAVSKAYKAITPLPRGERGELR